MLLESEVVYCIPQQDFRRRLPPQTGGHLGPCYWFPGNSAGQEETSQEVRTSGSWYWATEEKSFEEEHSFEGFRALLSIGSS